MKKILQIFLMNFVFGVISVHAMQKRQDDWINTITCIKDEVTDSTVVHNLDRDESMMFYTVLKSTNIQDYKEEQKNPAIYVV